MLVAKLRISFGDGGGGLAPCVRFTFRGHAGWVRLLSKMVVVVKDDGCGLRVTWHAISLQMRTLSSAGEVRQSPAVRKTRGNCPPSFVGFAP